MTRRQSAAEVCAWKAFYADRNTAECIGRLRGFAVYECPVCRLFHLTKRRRGRS